MDARPRQAGRDGGAPGGRRAGRRGCQWLRDARGPAPHAARVLSSGRPPGWRPPAAADLAVPPSPMIVAYLARDLQELSGGRFSLGLGTQVKGHIERRFSTPWTAPGPRLREYVLALRAIFESWDQGTPLNFQGEQYHFTLM